ncbi:capsular biosynthesis protein [Gilliamella sp. B2776]|uniref:capsule biosynthesis protein n=1 Tax=unclassified Gilliamella TaxID=2685620 RepID=UPI00226A21F1|nr:MULTISPECIES: capsular biosynthesis protein [unclassified Gilliamella]MCX8650738.1 capsular biosynthesis protein [Gilliamella sp. B2779]MCX8654102.1 capsular biosynthesis protein [Gilliamella sp. B2737]MCX8657157.1 capsular biosynthesis protein [Gilliamella sp. B2894]MCX8665621.1 capsular biosynthesis protein [Gilliamella sp. B2887]MCX8692586.1 capsular biosynthesis protein [Gilliamella sp. B2776]
MGHYLDELVQTKENILLLQGPVGPFFKNVAKWLQNQKCKVYKINLNGGDEFFFPQNSMSFYEPIGKFRQFLIDYIEKYNIDAIVVFGDCRAYHKIAKSIVKSNSSLSFWVFEEGYLRPHYITFEKNGVNGFSLTPKNYDFYENIHNTYFHTNKDESHFYLMIYYASIYYILMFLKRRKYSNYVHHRKTSLTFYVFHWGLASIRKFKARLIQPGLIKKINNDEYKPFYIFPLQCDQDFQIQVHSYYHSMRSYIFRVIRSFSLFADDESYLLIKHHPMDEGFNNYKHLIKKLAKRYGVSKRVIYIHGVPMPVLLRKAKGLVTVNSTCGLSALIHGLPVIVLGDAHYDIKGLTFQKGLHHFWKEGQKPDTELFERYETYLCSKSQIKGSVYYTDFELNIH